MTSSSKKTKSLDRLFATVAKPVNVNESDITITSIGNAHTTISVVTAPSMETDLSAWVGVNKAMLATELRKNGGILFRGFGVQSIEDFQRIFGVLTGEAMEYKQRTSPRTAVGDRVYTSTDHPADQIILMHNELSYGSSWPGKIAFFCTKEPRDRGETPVADVRAVYKLLRSETIERFASTGIRYVRNMTKGVGLSWQEVFQTTDTAAVESYCKNNGIEFEWVNPEHLRTSWVTPAVRVHHLTGEKIWFNHGYFYNEQNLESAVREVLGDENLPMNTFYGDGRRIETDVIEEIGKAYESARFKFSWKRSDLLYLDNMLVSHGREPFSGERQIVVAMGDPIQTSEA